MRTKAEILRVKVEDIRKARHQAVLSQMQMDREFRLAWFTYPDQRDRLREVRPELAKQMEKLGWG